MVVYLEKMWTPDLVEPKAETVDINMSMGYLVKKTSASPWRQDFRCLVGSGMYWMRLPSEDQDQDGTVTVVYKYRVALGVELMALAGRHISFYKQVVPTEDFNKLLGNFAGNAFSGFAVVAGA